MLEIIDRNKLLNNVESIFLTLIDCRSLQRMAVFVVFKPHTPCLEDIIFTIAVATMIVTFGRFLLSAAHCSCESSRPCSSQTEASALPRPAENSDQRSGSRGRDAKRGELGEEIRANFSQPCANYWPERCSYDKFRRLRRFQAFLC